MVCAIFSAVSELRHPVVLAAITFKHAEIQTNVKCLTLVYVLL